MRFAGCQITQHENPRKTAIVIAHFIGLRGPLIGRFVALEFSL